MHETSYGCSTLADPTTKSYFPSLNLKPLEAALAGVAFRPPFLLKRVYGTDVVLVA